MLDNRPVKEWHRKGKPASDKFARMLASLGLVVSFLTLLWTRYDTYEVNGPRLLVSSTKLFLLEGKPALSLITKNLSTNHGTHATLYVYAFSRRPAQGAEPERKQLADQINDIDATPFGSVFEMKFTPGADGYVTAPVDVWGSDTSKPVNLTDGSMLFVRASLEYKDVLFRKHSTAYCWQWIPTIGFERELPRCPVQNTMY